MRRNEIKEYHKVNASRHTVKINETRKLIHFLGHALAALMKFFLSVCGAGIIFDFETPVVIGYRLT